MAKALLISKAENEIEYKNRVLLFTDADLTAAAWVLVNR